MTPEEIEEEVFKIRRIRADRDMMNVVLYGNKKGGGYTCLED
jgi:hypothetical protein